MYRSLSSGNILADQLFADGQAMMARDDATSAADLFGQVLDRVPDWAPAWLALGLAEDRLGRLDAASIAFERLDRLDPAGLYGAPLQLARLGRTAQPATMPRNYVTALFNSCATTFDQHLVGVLQYRGPALIRDELQAAYGDRHYARALDLGCGTGLMADAMKDLVGVVDGIDLSPEMVEHASRTGLYRNLQVVEISEALAQSKSAAYDVVLAADVLIYIGEFDDLCGQVARVLAPGGCFGFTVETGDDADLRLGLGLRFTHSATYIRRVIADSGLEVIRLTEASARRERGAAVPGLVVVAAKP